MRAAVKVAGTSLPAHSTASYLELGLSGDLFRLKDVITERLADGRRKLSDFVARRGLPPKIVEYLS
jgi:hypothetical protein